MCHISEMNFFNLRTNSPLINSYIFISINSQISTKVPDFLSLKNNENIKAMNIKYEPLNHNKRIGIYKQ